MSTPREVAEKLIQHSVSLPAHEMNALIDRVESAIKAEREACATADVIILRALETEGSKVIVDSENDVLVWCEACGNGRDQPSKTTKHDDDCWLGNAFEYMPTSDCERALRAAAAIRKSDS